LRWQKEERQWFFYFLHTTYILYDYVSDSSEMEWSAVISLKLFALYFTYIYIYIYIYIQYHDVLYDCMTDSEYGSGLLTSSIVTSLVNFSRHTLLQRPGKLLISRASYRAVERRFNPVRLGSLETVKKILLTLLLTLATICLLICFLFC
jgi:hypothetical protein